MNVKKLKEYLKDLNDNDLICVRDNNFPDDYYELNIDDISNTQELEIIELKQYHQMYNKK